MQLHIINKRDDNEVFGIVSLLKTNLGWFDVF